ncbi:MAG: acetyl-CoA acetyltransferase [Planctomycetes bacterium]|nr:acetyl-CoA acetyltransferase [Planctomycetota bacterium]
MPRRVAIIGVGATVPRPVTPELSYRELIHEAAVRAYEEAGVEPREIGTFMPCTEDFYEGISISDEYSNDQLGAVLKPVHTIGGDGIHGIATAYMQIATGLFDTAVVEAHSKASNVLTPHHIMNYAMDPVLNRPLGENPLYVAGLEMSRFMHESGATSEECAWVVVKNRRNALSNPNGAFGAKVTVHDVLSGPAAFCPLGALEMAPPSDAAFVVVLAAEDRLPARAASPVWIRGVGWSNDSPTLETRSWARALYAEAAAQRAYRMAGIRNPARDIDCFEIDDTFSYKELQHLEALGICDRGEAGKRTARGETEIDGATPVNASGGSLGCGHMLDATGLFRTVECVRQLRGEAGQVQVKDAKTALAFGWRGVPTTSGACVVLGA